MDLFAQQQNDETYDQQSQQLEDSDTDIHDVDPNEIFRCNFQENVTFLK